MGVNMNTANYLSVVENDSDVAKHIADNFTKIKELKKNVDELSQKAEETQNAVNKIKEKKVGLFNKDIVQSLAVISGDLAENQIVAVNTQKITIEYQRELSEFMKYLLCLGTTNIALNRMVVRELEMRLNNASQEEIDELAQAEIINVIKQLKAQEDVMNKVDALKEIVKEHEDRISDQKNTIDKLISDNKLLTIMMLTEFLIVLICLFLFR